MQQTLLDYIKQARLAGIKDNEIKRELLAVNWKKEYIDEAFAGLGETKSQKLNAKIIRFVILGIFLLGIIVFGLWYADKIFSWGNLYSKMNY